MNLLVYLQPHRGGGVARHADAMVKGLRCREDVKLSLLSSRHAWMKHPEKVAQWEALPKTLHALPENLAERAWKLFNWPKMNRYIGDADWVYAPAEVRLPVTNAKLAVTVHDIQAFETDLPWSETPEHLAFRKKWAMWLPKILGEADLLLTVSEFSKQRMVELLGAVPDRVGVVGNGVDPVFYEYGAKNYQMDSVRPSLVIIGGLRMKKGAEATLKVAQVLENRGSPLQIDVIGQHDADWAERAKAHSNVHLHGRLPDCAVAERLAQSVALLFLSPYEGFGIPALEAMAAGTPAVVANLASLPEAVGSAGILVEPDDVEAVAEKLENLRTDPAARYTWIAKGKTHAQKYRWEVCVDRLLDLLRTRS